MIARFAIADVQRLINHTKAATSHFTQYGGKKASDSLVLVKDSGCYLMSGAADRKDCPVVYAKNLGPTKHIGGDDFCELIPFENLNTDQFPVKTVVIKITTRSLSISLEG